MWSPDKVITISLLLLTVVGVYWPCLEPLLDVELAAILFGPFNFGSLSWFPDWF